MSVEIRIGTSGDCRCPGPYSPDERPTCEHWWECDWGVLDNAEADPRRGLGHLMLITADWVAKLLDAPQRPTRGVGTMWATQDGDRVFVHYDGPECPPATWELFPAHFWDGKGPDDLLIGRWPD